MEILQADLNVPGWCSFRVPHGTNVHPTFPVPPSTTLYGLVANALGLAQDDYDLRKKLRFGLSVLKKGELVETYSQWMKWNPAKNQYRMLVTKQKLIFPQYRFYLQSEPSLLQEIEQALKNPKRILYLGESDDVVEISKVKISNWRGGQAEEIHSIVPVDAVGEQMPINNFDHLLIPVHFGSSGRDQYDMFQKLYYVNKIIKFDSPVSCFVNELNNPIILEDSLCY